MCFCSHFMQIHLINRSFIKRQTSDTPSDNEWQREVQLVRMTDSKWLFQLILLFFRIRVSKHPKYNSLNLEEDLEEGLLN